MEDYLRLHLNSQAQKWRTWRPQHKIKWDSDCQVILQVRQRLRQAIFQWLKLEEAPYYIVFLTLYHGMFLSSGQNYKLECKSLLILKADSGIHNLNLRDLDEWIYRSTDHHEVCGSSTNISRGPDVILCTSNKHLNCCHLGCSATDRAGFPCLLNDRRSHWKNSLSFHKQSMRWYGRSKGMEE